MPWAPDDILEPRFNLDTGAEIRGVHSRADLDSMSCTFGQLWQQQNIYASWNSQFAEMMLWISL
ncbi:hypothetical protein E4U15_005371 [Claviceps sp. LM218 group G6]|nr:hypothetical protein E4U15_005371 [Claviceps sp. LM218 group G6]